MGGPVVHHDPLGDAEAVPSQEEESRQERHGPLHHLQSLVELRLELDDLVPALREDLSPGMVRVGRLKTRKQSHGPQGV